MQLIARLSYTISEEFAKENVRPSTADTVNRFDGARQSDESADDMVALIRSGRRNSQWAVNL